jgi:virginiamycin B lyase
MLAVCLLAATIPVIPAHADRGDVTYYDLPPNTSGGAMVAAPDGSLWLAGWHVGQGLKIVVVTPEGDVTEFFAPPFSGEVPNDMAVGSDGNIWIAEFEYAYLLRVTPDHEVTKFKLRAQTLRSIAAGPDGNLWVTGYRPGSGPAVIFRVTVDGQATEFPLPEGNSGYPDHIMAGPDGRMWFTMGPDRLGTIDMDGTFGEVAITFYHPRWNLALGADGNVWFAAENGRVVRVTVDGETTEFSLPYQPSYIVAGADGALWAATSFADQLFRITTEGEIEDFPLDHRVGHMAAGPDGSIWFRAFRQGQLQVGRLDSGPPPATAPAVQRVRTRH